ALVFLVLLIHTANCDFAFSTSIVTASFRSASRCKSAGLFGGCVTSIGLFRSKKYFSKKSSAIFSGCTGNRSCVFFRDILLSFTIHAASRCRRRGDLPI